MLGHYQPISLQGICSQRICQQLSGMCRYLVYLSQKTSTEHMLAFTMQKIRPYYINTLPTLLRTELIEKTMQMLCNPLNDGSSLVFEPAVLYLLALLLSRGIKKLKIMLCCYYGCSHQIYILQLLASQGSSLQSLELCRSILLRMDYNLMYKMLLNMKNLSSLTLQHIADDTMLYVIGKSCPKLAFLDVFCSKDLTDEGLRKLLLHLKLRDKPTPEYTIWSRLKRVLETWKKSGNRQQESQMREYYECKNALCDTLRVLNVDKTSVTCTGILLVLSKVPLLKSLKYCQVGRVMEIMYKVLDDLSFPFPLNLIEARICKTTLRRLELVAQACPKIEKLYISEPQHPPNALARFSQITYLTIQNAMIETEWLNGFYDYLRSNGKNLCYLDFQVERKTQMLEIDLRDILISCPNLHTLIKSEFKIIWTRGCDPAPLNNLKIIQLGYTTDALVIVKIFSLAPELETFHIFNCPNLTDKHLTMIKPPNRFSRSRMFNPCVEDSLSNLSCFYIHEMNKVSIFSVLNVFTNYKQLKYLGNVENWGTSREEAKVLKETIDGMNIHFCSSSHWLQNKCIPKL